MTEQYSNREIDSFLKRQDEAHGEFRVTLNRIEDQTILTNGKITEIQKWRERVIGATGILTLILLPILTWGLWQITKMDEKIKIGVQEVLSAYEVEIK